MSTLALLSSSQIHLSVLSVPYTSISTYFLFSITFQKNHNGVAAAATNLIIVAGHSVTISGHLEDANQDEHDWFLLDYQKHRGLPHAIVAHMQAAMAQAQQDPSSLLVFSGGETRGMTPESEGASYFRVADAMELWPGSGVRARTVTEEFATDSFQNL